MRAPSWLPLRPFTNTSTGCRCAGSGKISYLHGGVDVGIIWRGEWPSRGALCGLLSMTHAPNRCRVRQRGGWVTHRSASGHGARASGSSCLKLLDRPWLSENALVMLMPTAGVLGDSASSPDLSDLSPTPSLLPRLRRRTTPLSTEFRLLLDASCNHRAFQRIRVTHSTRHTPSPTKSKPIPRRRLDSRGRGGGGPRTSEVLALRFRSSGVVLPLASVCVLTGLAFALLLPGVPVAGALSTMYMGGTIRFLRG